MSDDRMLFYFAVIAVICLTVMVSTCSYHQKSCTSEAIKAGVKTEDIRSLCKQL